MAKRLRIPKIGDVFGIPLPDGQFGYCRTYRDVTFGVFDFVAATNPAISVLIQKPIAFWVSCLSRAVTDANWQLIGNLPFATEKDSWPPPCREVHSDMPDRCRVCYRGKTSTQWFSSKSVRKFEPQCFFGPAIVVDRIVRQVLAREVVDPVEYTIDYADFVEEFGEDYQAGIDKRFDGKWEYPDFPMQMLDHLFPLPKTDAEKHATETPSGKRVVIQFFGREAVIKRDEIKVTVAQTLEERGLGCVGESQVSASKSKMKDYAELVLNVRSPTRTTNLISTILKRAGLALTTNIEVDES